MSHKSGLFIYHVHVLLFWAPVIAFVFFSRYPSIRCHEYSAGMSVFDSLFRNLILTSQFVKGWGQPSHLKRLMGGLVEHAISSISFVFHFKFKHYIYLLVHFIDMMSMYIYIFKLLKNNVLRLYMMKACWNKTFSLYLCLYFYLYKLY